MHRRRTRHLTAVLLLAAAAIGWSVPVASHSWYGDPAGDAWEVFDVPVPETGTLTVTIAWDEPGARVNAFLRPPGRTTAVATDTSDGTSPKTIVHEITETGTWTVGVKVRDAATTVTVEATLAAADGTPPPVTVAGEPATWWQTDGRVRDVLAVGDQVWLTGHFDALRPPGTAKGDPASVARCGLAVLDRTTGELLPLDTPDLRGNGWALAASPDGSTVYVGGTFRSVDGVTRRHLAAVDTATGALTDWDPDANSLVRTLLTLPDGTVLAGGQFTRVAGRAQPYLAAIGADGALDLGWRPDLGQQSVDPCPPRCEPFVHALSIGLDGALLVGGHFGTVNGVNRTNAAALDLAAPDVAEPTAVLAWNPHVFTPSTSATQLSVVTEIAVPPADGAHTDRVLLCGDFKRVNGQLSTNVGIVDATTGTAVPGTDVQSNGGTPACAFDATTMYVGGHFDRVGPGQEGELGVTRLHLAALDPADGSVLPWDPTANTRLGVHTMLLTDGGLYTGGDFTRTARRLQQGVAFFPAL